MNAMSRMSPPQFGHSSGNPSPTRAMSLAQAIREVSCERGCCFALQQPSEAEAADGTVTRHYRHHQQGKPTSTNPIDANLVKAMLA